MALYRDEQGQTFSDSDLFREFIRSSDMIREGSALPGSYLPFPGLSTDTPTLSDQQLYKRLQDVYKEFSPDPSTGQIAPSENVNLPSLLNDIAYGPLHPGVAQYNDPNLRNFVQNTIGNAGRTDVYNPLGDQFTSALALFGAAAGGAGAFGAYGAGAAGGAGAGAGIGAGAGTAAEAATLSAGGALGASGLTAGIPAAGVGAGALGAGTGTALGTAGSLAGIAGSLGTILSQEDVAALQGLDTSGLTAPVPSGQGVLSTGAATPSQVASIGSPGLFGTSITTGDALKALPTLLGLVNTVSSQANASGAQGRANDAVNLQTDIAKQLFGEAGPIRTQVNAELLNYLNTGQLPLPLQQGLTQANTQGRQGLEKQYRVARENLLSLTPARGGQLNKSLADLERSRADSVGQLAANLQSQYELPLRQALFGNAATLGSGQTATALSGINAGTAQQVALANQATLQATSSGQAAGSLLALALKKSQQNKNSSSSTFAF